MRERLATQKKAMRALLDSIAVSVGDARTMMRRLKAMNFEGDIMEIEKVFAKKKTSTKAKASVRKKKAVRAKKTVSRPAKAKTPAKRGGNKKKVGKK
ncbi:hypothetical protein M2103_001925 [Ereboglobus sp. PH5-5]|nr:hypothetical protein [Ereboglobus sp. PH5-10]MDF9833693.1 hypothetical protein [Ereboglobus sp. PH5-5]